MGWVHDNDVGLFHINHHLRHRNFVTTLPALVLHLRIAFGILHLIHDFLAGHHVLPVVLGMLPSQINEPNGQGNRQNNRKELNEQAKKC